MPYKNPRIVLMALTLMLFWLITAPTQADEPRLGPLASPSPATRPSTQSPAVALIKNADGNFTADLDDLPLQAVLAQMSAAGYYSILLSASLPAESVRITLHTDSPIPGDDLVQLLDQILMEKGLRLLPNASGRLLRLVRHQPHPDTGNSGNAVPAVGQQNLPVAAIAAVDEWITQVMPLRFANGEQIQAELQPLLGPQSYITGCSSSYSLIMMDTSARVKRLAEIIKKMDEAAEAAALAEEPYDGSPMSRAALSPSGTVRRIRP